MTLLYKRQASAAARQLPQSLGRVACFGQLFLTTFDQLPRRLLKGNDRNFKVKSELEIDLNRLEIAAATASDSKLTTISSKLSLIRSSILSIWIEFLK